MRTRLWLRALFFNAVACGSLCAWSGAPALAKDAPGATAPDAVDKAQNLFKKGAALYEIKHFTPALEQFRASYAAVASPNSRLYVARCLAELGTFDEAYLEFDGAAEEAGARAATEPRYAKTQQTALVERDEIVRKIGLVTVTVSHPEAALSLEIAGKQVPQERWGKVFPVKPGSTEIVLRPLRGDPASTTLNVTAGEAKSLNLDAAPSVAVVAKSSEPEPNEVHEAAATPGASRAYLRPYAYVAAAVGVAGFATFTVGGLMANSTYSDLSSSCIGACPEGRNDDINAGKTQQLIANIGLAAGAVGIAAGTTLLILSFSGGQHEPQSTATSTRLTVGPGFASVTGTF